MPTDPNTLDGLNAVVAPTDGSQTSGHDRSSLLRRVLTWLRGGYPNGVPREDYVALFGVLHRQLTEAEIAEVVGHLTAAGDANTPITTQQVREVISRMVLERPSDEDVARVNAHLVSGGWALAEEADEQA